MGLVKRLVLVNAAIVFLIFSCKKDAKDGVLVSIQYERINECEGNCDYVVVRLKNKTKKDILLFQGEISLEPSLYQYKRKNDVLVDSSLIPSWALKLPPKEPPVWLNKPSVVTDSLIDKGAYPETKRLLSYLVEEYKKKKIENDVYLEDLLIFFNKSVFLKKDSLWIKKFRYNFDLRFNDSTDYKIKVSYFNNDYGLNIIQDQLNFIEDTLNVNLPEHLDGYYIWLDTINAELTIPSQ